MGSRGVAIPGWFLLFAVGLLVFAVLAWVASREPVDPFDLAATEWLHGYASPLSDTLMRGITGLGSTVFLALLVGVAAFALAVRGDRAEALLLVLALVGTLVLNESLKVLFDRPRPDFEWAEPAAGPAFPSGHSMNSFVVYVTLGLVAVRLWGAWRGIVALSLALVVAALVGISRVYLGVHWATDAAAGAVAGALFLLVLVPAWSGGWQIVARSPRSQPRGTPGAGP